jgi:serine/threonine protein kinase
MTREEYCSKIEEAINAIDFHGTYIAHERYGNGHINDTFLIQFQQENTAVKYILQRMNHEIFKNPEQLMKNICGVTEFLKEKIKENHGDINRETMNVIYTKNGEPYYKDSIGSYWRAYRFIEDATSFDQVVSPEDFYQSAVAFGRFQCLLKDYKAETLYEVIPDFHNTPVRFQTFQEAVEKDICGRVKEVLPEIEFLRSREKDMKVCMDLLDQGRLPLRVTHNDTKLNNIMIDNKTGKGICVIDLDTVMPGLSITDFGDSIRFGANEAAEDETDLSKVSLNLELFEIYAKGYLEGCNGSLSQEEVEMLPMGAKTMTLECGMRFLTDYLQGDTYFRIHREKHNLDRCRTQLKLVESMEQKWDEMNSVIKKYR